jgi:septal ring factor EnvC (AmiA/AmiB activator)
MHLQETINLVKENIKRIAFNVDALSEERERAIYNLLKSNTALADEKNKLYALQTELQTLYSNQSESLGISPGRDSGQKMSKPTLSEVLNKADENLKAYKSDTDKLTEAKEYAERKY